MCKGLAKLPATCLKSAKDIKHKIGFLLQKSEPQASDQKPTKDKDVSVMRAAPPGDVAKWKESFNYMMKSEGGRVVFTNFLRSEFSEENMDFWNACQEYKKISPIKMAAKAKLIYYKYVEVDSPNEVNLDSLTREGTKQNLETPTRSAFDEAEKRIYILMEKDSYRRFVKSKLVQDMCQTPTADAHEKKGKKSSCGENR
ncbi:regulator of G-protein signaling 4 [Lampris incognitus]|uniref:regulator of G-protein signaling 4 n=1 Tax=Lampris incognitus TaxID=2546036 RepID=UPI0024B4915B|nr:regulator of G-protein signaling 4 [Lampris incognitus]